MGIIRALGKIFGGFIFSLCLVLIVFSLAFAQFTEYQSLQPVMVRFLEKQLVKQVSEEQLNLTYSVLLEQCKDKEKVTVPFDQANIKKITLKCSDLSSSKSSNLPKLISSSVFDDLYYKKYECKFIQCLQQSDTEKFTIFLSAYANKFFYSLANYLVIGLVIGAIILLISERNLFITFKSIGISCIFVGITYFITPFLKKYIVEKLPAEAILSMEEIVDQMLIYLSKVLLYTFIVGAILTIMGYIGSYLSKEKLKKRKNNLSFDLKINKSTDK